MRPFTDTLPFDDALRLVRGGAVPTANTEAVPLTAADGRVLAVDVRAAIDVPPFERAAMDGYAVVAADTAGASEAAPAVLRSIGRVFTGERAGIRVAPGTCMEIATGAPMPDGADAVVMVEHTTRTDAGVRFTRPVTPRQHVGARGGDIMAGHLVLEAGAVLTPARIGVLAALGHT
ncbi:MAG: molybdenum cofactor biosynthesis protein, partial [Acidobacteria bacterium]|nr:molybdenum cofactor biosynthesis protein [Acidobacteriota bacterium]